MKKLVLFAALALSFFAQKTFAQTNRVIGPVEKQMVDSVCSSLERMDISKITTQDEAVAAFTQSIGEHADLLNALATERKVDISDMAAMKSIGVDLGFDLFKMKCEKFMKLSTIMAVKTAKKDNSESDVTLGTLIRIDQKGFNYIVISDTEKNEKSFIWLRQFPGSEKLMNGITPFIGKKVKITWQTMEVYFPQLKGYSNVKEIKYLDIF